MAHLALMPPININKSELVKFGQMWIKANGRLPRTPPYSSSELGRLFDHAVATALAVMLGGIKIVQPSSTTLTPPEPDVVEIGNVRIIGGVRPQNFDVGYRPDGVRFVFDSKTLNDTKSVGKNWQNMVNDLATEATTVHTRFPHAVVAFMVIIPYECLTGATQAAMIETLERLGRRTRIDGPQYMAEALSLVLWHPKDGEIDLEIPSQTSPLRIEQFHKQIEEAYISRYKGLPPHD
jgi:hypothetical protein